MSENQVKIEVVIYDDLSLNAQLVAALDQVIRHQTFKMLPMEVRQSAAIWVATQFKLSQHNESE